MTSGFTSPCFVHSHLDSTLAAAAAAAAASSSRPPSTNIRRDSRNRSNQQSHPSLGLGTSSNAQDARPSHVPQSTSVGVTLQDLLSPVSPHLPSPAFKPPFATFSPITPRAIDHCSLPPPQTPIPQLVQEQDGEDEDEGEMTEGEEPESLTRQLALTATSVREMSKQLGRARIKGTVQSILIITKARDNHLIKLTRELAIWLMQCQSGQTESGTGRRIVVYVDHQLKRSKRFDVAGLTVDHPKFFRPLKARHPFQRRFSRTNSMSSNSSATSHGSSTSGQSGDEDSSSSGDAGQLRYWTAEMCSKSPELFDFVITLGGDGTVLFASWLFQRVVPPIIPFALGSLGFLTNFDYAHYPSVLTQAMKAGVRVNLRMRFKCTVYRASLKHEGGRRAVRSGKTGRILMERVGQEGWEALENGEERMERRQRGEPSPTEQDNGIGRKKAKEDKEIRCFTSRPEESFEVLNELVVDRGPSPYVSLLELFGDDHHMTTVQADGLTVSTPTGSTAYSLSAGGSLVHPEVPALLITPICPHTLSFRPMLLPESMDLRICVPYSSRSTAWASFDGRGRVELRQGDHIKVTASAYPFPTVCADNQSTDWFHAISRTLRWNERERQKSFVVVEEEHGSGARKAGGGRKNGIQKTKKRANTIGFGRVAERQDPAVAVEEKRVEGLAGLEEEEEDEDEDDEDDEEEDEDETYDIDDLSSDTQLDSLSVPSSPHPPESKRPSFKAVASEPLLTGRLEDSHQFEKAIKHQQGLIRRLSSRRDGSGDEDGEYEGRTSKPGTIRSRIVKAAGQEKATIATAACSNKKAVGMGKRPSIVSLRSPNLSGGGGAGPKTFAVWGQDQSSDASSSSDYE
ncbi:hypothetical protein CROQUDRAFT_136625 [Cronartium quercuum f. sp. fusiforme G11]|uniref:ATP-NAD kinase n=1 Tax=Cronartium quercuum f. sp. fusiforme G11 TaxID=708437 RepID=A0A9P6N774_9BASI|nr:hypothetical protein CROQUDRAFT_136625 [Cronartium quercuum f. sp. fusiforme G11]